MVSKPTEEELEWRKLLGQLSEIADDRKMIIAVSRRHMIGEISVTTAVTLLPSEAESV